MHTLYLLTAALLAAPSLAHMAMIKPFPLKHKANPNTAAGGADYSYSAPLKATGSDFPCKNYHLLLDTPEGTPVETWPAGTVQSMGIGDASGANHNGGSCQIALSEDSGVTFKVIKSFIGACPMTNKQVLDVEIPKEAKSGKTLFAWTWFNKTGQREMYMNCAVVTITGGGSGLASSEWPNLFTANIGGTCKTTEGIDVVFPNPGKNVVTAQGNVNLGPPAGECGGGAAAAAAAAGPAAGSSTGAPAAAATSPISSASPTSPASASPAATGNPAACSCVCGGPGGYLVNIVPAAVGVSGGAMAPRTPPPEYSAAAGTGDEEGVVVKSSDATCGVQRRDQLRRHGLKSRRGTAASTCS